MSMIEALQFEFMRNALIAALLASITCGIIGTLVVVNRIVFLAGGIAHAAYGGIGIAFFFRISTLLGAMGFSLITSLVMAGVTLKHKHRADTIIGVLWAAGMALGIILVDLTPGYNVDLMSYLFGSILAVPAKDLWIMFVMDLLIVGIVVYFYKNFLAMSYDEEFALVSGVPVKALHFTLTVMIALSVVMIIRIVGLILVIALLSIPPYIAERYVGSMGKMMILSILLSILFTSSGLWISYTFNLTSGATIIMVATVFFFLSLFADHLRQKRRASV